jgi:uncharacterized protein (DUF4415 family)
MKKVLTKTAELTPEEIEQLKALNTLREDQLDTNDIPEAALANMRQGVRGAHFRPLKTPLTIRLDADVVAWFKETAASGKYQSEINRVLRRHMTDRQRKPA